MGHAQGLREATAEQPLRRAPRPVKARPRGVRRVRSFGSLRRVRSTGEFNPQ